MALFSDSENARFDFLKVWSQNGTWVDIDLLAGSAAVQRNGVPVEGDPDDATWSPSQKSKIQWKFYVYIDFISAMLEGIDEFEIAITSKKRVKSEYFSGEKSPVSVSQDIRDYIKRFKQSVKETDEAEEYVSKTFGITEFIDDNIVSDISSGTINKKNKNSKFPEMEVTYARKIKGRRARKYRKNYGNYPRRLLYTTEGIQELSRRLFNDTGTDPATVGFIEFPIISDEDLEDGSTSRKPWRHSGRRLEKAIARYPVDESGKSTVSSTDLGANESSKSIPDSLYQLYNKFVKIERSRKFEYYDVRKKKVKVKYLPTTITIDQTFEDSAKMLSLLKKRSMYLEIQWKKDGIVIQTERNTFSPSQVVSRLTASANKYRAQAPTFINYKPSSTQRDRIYVKCRSYGGAKPEVEEGMIPWSKKTISIFGTWPMIGNRDLLETKLLSKEMLRGNRRWSRRQSLATPYFGTKSYPRAYRISTTDSAGSGNPICNINWITRPNKLSISPDDNGIDNPSAIMMFAGPETARVLVGGIPSTVTRVKFTVKKLGTLDSDADSSFDAEGKTSQYTKSMRKPKTRRYGYRTIGRRAPLEDGATYQVDCKFYVGGTLQKDLSAQGVYTHYAGQNSVFTSEASKRLSFGLTAGSSAYGALKSTHNMTLSQTVAESVESEFLSQVNTDGEAELYSTELEESKTETGITIQYRIERINWNTGRVETILNELSGETVAEYIETNGKDYPLAFSVEGAQALDKFSYVIKANVTESAAMSYTTVVKETDVNTGNQYLYRYRKWRNDEISAASGNYDKGVLPPVQAIVKDSMADAVNNSVTGIASSTTFTPGKITPRLRYVNAVQDSQNSTNWIKWRVRGDESLIDHFVITAEYNGFRAPVGTAAPIKSGNQYLYSENKLFGLYGEVEYKVYIVLKDFRYLYSRKSARVLKTTNIPSFAMVRKRRRRRRGR